MTEQTKITAQHKNIHCALAAAQLEFGTVTKGATNPAFKTRYADLSDVASVVIPALARHGVCVLHYLTGETLSAMRTEFVHGESDTRVACDVPLLVDRQNMQGMKSATTYAKRIGLESLSGVAPEDDDGNAAAQAAPRRQEPRQSRTSDGDAIAHACAALGAADSLDALKAIWTDLPAAMKTAPQVIEAKEARKTALTAAKPATADTLAGDEIPY